MFELLKLLIEKLLKTLLLMQNVNMQNNLDEEDNMDMLLLLLNHIKKLKLMIKSE
jgi:hypothetical protein